MTSVPKFISTFQILFRLYCFILAHVILYFCNSCPCLYAVIGKIKFIYLMPELESCSQGTHPPPFFCHLRQNLKKFTHLHIMVGFSLPTVEKN